MKIYETIHQAVIDIESVWKNENYSSEKYYKVAGPIINGIDLSELSTIENQSNLLHLPMVASIQSPNTFSDLYIRVVNTQRSFVEILNWHGGHVNIHDHDFSAIQNQVFGRGLNIIYDFKDRVQKGAVTFGESKVREAKIWYPGTQSVVRHGNIDPHSVFHIDNPSVSILFRTNPTARMGSQSNYFKLLKGNYYVNNSNQRKKLTALALIYKQSTNSFNKVLEAFLGNQSLSESFFMLIKLGSYIISKETKPLLVDLSKKSKEWHDIIESVTHWASRNYLTNEAHSLSNDLFGTKLALFSAGASFTNNDFNTIQNSQALINYDLRSLIKNYLKSCKISKNSLLTHLSILGIEI